MAHLLEAAVRLAALCALSATVELLLDEEAKKRGVRFLLGVMALVLIARAVGELLP